MDQKQKTKMNEVLRNKKRADEAVAKLLSKIERGLAESAADELREMASVSKDIGKSLLKASKLHAPKKRGRPMGSKNAPVVAASKKPAKAKAEVKKAKKPVAKKPVEAKPVAKKPTKAKAKAKVASPKKPVAKKPVRRVARSASSPALSAPSLTLTKPKRDHHKKLVVTSVPAAQTASVIENGVPTPPTSQS